MQKKLQILFLSLIIGFCIWWIIFQWFHLWFWKQKDSFETLIEQSPIQTIILSKKSLYSWAWLYNIAPNKKEVIINIPKQSQYYLDISSLPKTVTKLTLRGTYKNPDIVIRDKPLYLTGLSQLTWLKELLITDFPLEYFNLTTLPLSLQKFEFFNTRVEHLITWDQLSTIPYVHILINGPHQYFYSQDNK